MKDILIKEINNFDWKLISRLEKLEKRNLGSKASINRWVIPVIIRYGKLIVAQKGESDSDIIGVCELIKDCKSEGRIFIFSFYVDRDYRRKGAGRRLLSKVVDILKDEGFEEVELTVDSNNKSAASLYKRFGFKKIALREDEYGRGVNRDLMRLKL